MVSSGSFMHSPNAVEAAAVKGPTILVVDSPTTLDSGGLGSYPLTDERPGGNHAATRVGTAAGAAAGSGTTTDSGTRTGSASAAAPRTDCHRHGSGHGHRHRHGLGHRHGHGKTSLPSRRFQFWWWLRHLGERCRATPVFQDGPGQGLTGTANWVAGVARAVPLRLCVKNVFTPSGARSPGNRGFRGGDRG